MSDEATLSQLLSVWERERTRGRDVSAAALCAGRPELAPELERRIQLVRNMNRLREGETLSSNEGTDPGPAVAEAPGAERLPSVPGYKVLEELGRGGMGVVYKARQKSLNRIVALKMTLAGGLGPDELLRFRTEAEAIARLEHPNIVQIHEVGEHEGRPFFSLEYCPGGSLLKKLNGTPLPAREAAALVETLARAMQAAHGRRIIHRDLKPANVLLTADGTPKITDFGLAKKLDEVGQTQSGAIMGTPSYMAPEQASGKAGEVGPAADVYALGAVLYECLTGRPPFRAATTLDTLWQVLHDEVLTPSRLARKLPRDLETVCLTCLRKDPHRRYASADDLADDLRRFLAGETVRARPVGPAERAWRRCRRHPVVCALLALVTFSLVAGVTGVLHFAVRAAANASRADKAREAAEEAAAKETEAHRRARESADSLQLSLVRQHISAGTYSLESNDRAAALWSYARAWELDANPDNADAHRLRLGFTLQAGPQLVGVCLHPRPVLDAVFDAAGKTVLTRTDEPRAYLWDASTGRLVAPPLAHGGVVRAMAFNPSGDRAATGAADGSVRLWDPRSGKLLHTLPHGAEVHAVSFRHDGKLLAAATEAGAVHFWDPDSGAGGAPSLTLGAAVYHVAFSPDGRQVVTADAAHAARVWDVATGKAVTEVLPHEDHRAEDEVAISYRCWPVFSPDGTALATVHPNRRNEAAVVVWDLASGKPRFPPLKRTYFVHRLQFSPDGSRLLALNGDAGHLFDAAAGKLLLSLAHPRETPHGCFHPDGKVLVTCSTGGLIHQWDVATGKALEQPLRCADGVHSLVFSANGDQLLAASHDGTARVWRLGDAVRLRPYAFDCGGADRALFRENDELVRRSPDGRLELRYAGSAGTRLTRGGGAGPELRLDHPHPVVVARFSADGRRLLTQDRKATARCWEVDTGRPAGPPLPLGATVYSAGFSADGRRLLTVEEGPAGGLAGRAATVWDVDRGRPLLGPLRRWDTGRQRFGDRGLDGQITQAALSPDGTRLALGSDATGVLGVWDVDAGRELVRTQGYRGVLYQIEFSADGRRFLTNGSDTVARLWDAATAAPAGPPLRHPRFCRKADLAPDGWRVVTVDSASVIRLWDGRTGNLLGRLSLPLTDNRLWFSRDGRRLVLNAGKHVLDLPAYGGPAEHLPALLRLLTGLERDADESLGPVEPLAFRNDPGLDRRAWTAWRGRDDDAGAQPPPGP
jgi:WD40 repeat protein/tRNA A-37 threonylcarbamoyl transferase component Bud32